MRPLIYRNSSSLSFLMLYFISWAIKPFEIYSHTDCSTLMSLVVKSYAFFLLATSMHPMALLPSLIGAIRTFLVTVWSLLSNWVYSPSSCWFCGRLQSFTWTDCPELNTVERIFGLSLSNEMASLSLPVMTLQYNWSLIPSYKKIEHLSTSSKSLSISTSLGR